MHKDVGHNLASIISFNTSRYFGVSTYLSVPYKSLIAVCKFFGNRKFASMLTALFTSFACAGNSPTGIENTIIPDTTACVKIAGNWKGSETTDLACIDENSESLTMRVADSGDFTFAQVGCSVSYYIQNTNIFRSGTIRGNDLQMSGDLIVIFSDAETTAEAKGPLNIKGVVSGDIIELSGTGNASGTFNNISFTCDVTSSVFAVRAGEACSDEEIARLERELNDAVAKANHFFKIADSREAQAISRGEDLAKKRSLEVTKGSIDTYSAANEALDNYLESRRLNPFACIEMVRKLKEFVNELFDEIDLIIAVRIEIDYFLELRNEQRAANLQAELALSRAQALANAIYACTDDERYRRMAEEIGESIMSAREEIRRVNRKIRELEDLGEALDRVKQRLEDLSKGFFAPLDNFFVGNL